MKKILSIISMIIIIACISCGKENNTTPSDDNFTTTLNIKKITNLNDDFILGMDISSLSSLELSGVKFYDFDGQEKSLFAVLKQAGINYIRIRVWNNPYDKDGNGYGGGNCDLDNMIKLGKEATSFGMKVLIDFHYSDFWADPGKQKTPKEWSDYSIEEKTLALYQFTKSSLERAKSEQIDVGMVQIGNETNGSICEETEWDNMSQLFNAGSRAVREIFPDAKVVLHFTNPEREGLFDYYASQLNTYNVDYDVFATSYYPYWHGTLSNLSNVLSSVANTYNKKVMVAETSYAYTGDDTDFSTNQITNNSDVQKDYPFSEQGQADHIYNLVNTILNQTTNGIGVFYWEGAWISVGGKSWNENHVLWERYGSGWASSFSAEYDPDDAGRYYGGSGVDNQALFDSKGHPLESLKVFKLIK